MKTFVIASAVVKNKDKFLIGKRARGKKFAPGTWEFISGFPEEKEPLEDTILRELKEETGLKGKVVRSAEPYMITDSEGRWVVIPFLINVTSDKVFLNTKDHEELRWVSRADLESFKDIVDLSNLKACGLL